MPATAIANRFFIYTPGAIAFAGAATQTPQLTIDIDAPFVVVSISVLDSATALVDYTIMLLDSKTSRDWFNNPINAALLNTDGVNTPFYLPARRRLPPRSTVRFTIQKATAGAANFWIHLNGYKQVPVTTVE